MATNLTSPSAGLGVVHRPGESAFEAQTYSKVAWRLLPFLFACYVFAYLDRVNVGFAKLQMLSDLKFSETIYGLGAGIFFVGYSSSRSRATSSCTGWGRACGSAGS